MAPKELVDKKIKVCVKNIINYNIEALLNKTSAKQGSMKYSKFEFVFATIPEI